LLEGIGKAVRSEPAVRLALTLARIARSKMRDGVG
jgi:hypothetical protein